jgi:anhydro-N-acetylmuramic acid kinase
MARAVRVLGAMSGAGCAGVDAAVIETDGAEVLAIADVAHRPYTPSESETLAAAVGRMPEDPCVLRAAEVVETALAEVCAGFAGIDLVGVEGHALGPGAGAMRAGAGEVLAQILGVPVVSDFASADMAMGGQGAPLEAFYHHALARRLRAAGPVVFLGIGAWASVTWADPAIPAPEHGCMAFDCGPAPGGTQAPAGGPAAEEGTVDERILARFIEEPFFRRMPPKTLGAAWAAPDVARLSPADASATRAAACAAGVALAFEHFPRPPVMVLVHGRGRHDRRLMAMLEAACDCAVHSTDAMGLPGDALAAQARGYLAARVAQGLATTAPATTGVRAPVGGGLLSRPGPQGLLAARQTH